jgi:hypothetical protein
MSILGIDWSFLVTAFKSRAVTEAAKFLVEQAPKKLRKEKKVFCRQDPLFSANYYRDENVLLKRGYFMPLPYVEKANFLNSKHGIQFIGEVNDEDFSLCNELTEYGDKILKLFRKRKPKTYNDYVLRVADMIKLDKTGNKWKFILQQTTYFDAVKTNFTLDYPLKDLKVRLIKHGSNKYCKDLREFELFYRNKEGTGKLQNFKDSLLANLIGVSCVLYLTSEHKIVVSYRKKDQAIFENMPGPSSSGTVKWPMTMRRKEKFHNLLKYVEEEMLREIAEEINLPEKKINNIVPLAFCRELIRGGLPQFFFLAKSDISWEELKRKAPEARDFHFEFDKVDWDELSHKKLENYSEDQRKFLGVFVNPELTTNLLYARDYLSSEKK